MTGKPYPFPEWMSLERRSIEAIDRKSGFRLQHLTSTERRLVAQLIRYGMVERDTGDSYVTSSLCQQFLKMERDRAFGITD